MMPGYSTNSAQTPKPLVPAWLLSILIHLSIFAILFVTLRPVSRGAPSARAGSMGIVLRSANSVDAQNDGNQFHVIQAQAVAEDLTPPLLLAATTTETNEPASNKPSDESAKPPQASSSTSKGTAKSETKKSSSGSKKGARPASVAARLGTSSSSNYAQVSVFGVEGKGSKFIYVFDRSASMEGPPLAAAKKQLLESLNSLETVHQFHIMFFNTKTQSFDISGGGRRIAFASERNKKLAANFVGGITADGGTDRMLALREAINFSPDVIFFLTDDDDPMSPAELAEIARANRKVQAAICVIEFGRKPAATPNNSLARLAQQSGGQYGYVDTTKLPLGQPIAPAKPRTK